MRVMICCALTTVMLFSGCMLNFTGVKGSGVSATQNRTVDDFHAISVSGTADVKVAVGGEKSVVVTVDDNLIEMVKTEVNNGELKVYTDGNYSTSIGLDIVVTVPMLDRVTVSGVGDLTASDVSGSNLKVKVSGVGEAKITGEVDELDVSVSGTGDAELKDLIAKKVKVSVSGVGGAEVFASESVDASASGTGDVKIFGNPSEVTKSASGIADIELAK
jgi:hypothetical protein